MPSIKLQRAFSLVELSIVLVILGLLTGGILAGQSLIRAAELRSVTTEYDRYKTVISTFRDKYFALPGDMKNATAFWTKTATCPGTSTTPSTDAATCNGDGDGEISNSANNGHLTHEQFRFWQHLANAGLIEGTFSGVTRNGAYNSLASQIGLNVPGSKLANGAWYVDNYAYPTMGNRFRMAAINPSSTPVTNYVENPLLKPEEAWNIDTKIDDGQPTTGVARYLSSASCISGTDYALSVTSIACSLQFKTGY